MTIRQSRKKRALNSSSLRLHEDELTSTPTPELGINGQSNGVNMQRSGKSSAQGIARRTPRERKRANKNSLHLKGGRGGSGVVRNIFNGSSTSKNDYEIYSQFISK